jgi:hypothetical protein
MRMLGRMDPRISQSLVAVAFRVVVLAFSLLPVANAIVPHGTARHGKVGVVTRSDISQLESSVKSLGQDWRRIRSH